MSSAGSSGEEDRAEIRLPEATRRLFPDAEPDAAEPLDPRSHAPHVIGRILEDGDRRDLAWLFRTYGGERVKGWLRQRGDRQLSRRSRAFWRVVLDGEAGDGSASGAGRDVGGAPTSRTAHLRSELWPL